MPNALDEICDNCNMRNGYHFGNGSCPNRDLSDAGGAKGFWRKMAKPIFQPQVKPGQVWVNDGKHKWCITSVDRTIDVAYGYRVGDDPSTAEEFGSLDDYGHPKDWHGFYLDVTAVPIRSQSKAKAEERSDLDFFRQPTTPGYCVCGIAREQCNYHR